MKLFFEIKLVDETGNVHGRLRREIHQDAAFIGERFVDNMKMGTDLGLPMVSFEEVVQVMRVREFRRQLLVAQASQLGAALADHLEDREGWHGVERAERVREKYKWPKGLDF